MATISQMLLVSVCLPETHLTVALVGIRVA